MHENGIHEKAIWYSFFRKGIKYANNYVINLIQHGVKDYKETLTRTLQIHVLLGYNLKELFPLDHNRVFPKSILKNLQNLMKNIWVKGGFETGISCVKKLALYLSAMKAYVTERTLKLTLIHAPVISQNFWIRWIHWKFCFI